MTRAVVGCDGPRRSTVGGGGGGGGGGSLGQPEWRPLHGYHPGSGPESAAGPAERGRETSGRARAPGTPVMARRCSPQ